MINQIMLPLIVLDLENIVSYTQLFNFKPMHKFTGFT